MAARSRRQGGGEWYSGCGGCLPRRNTPPRCKNVVSSSQHHRRRGPLAESGPYCSISWLPTARGSGPADWPHAAGPPSPAGCPTHPSTGDSTAARASMAPEARSILHRRQQCCQKPEGILITTDRPPLRLLGQGALNTSTLCRRAYGRAAPARRHGVTNAVGSSRSILHTRLSSRRQQSRHGDGRGQPHRRQDVEGRRHPQASFRTPATVVGSSCRDAVFSTTRRHNSSSATPPLPLAMRRAARMLPGVARCPGPADGRTRRADRRQSLRGPGWPGAAAPPQRGPRPLPASGSDRSGS